MKTLLTIMFMLATNAFAITWQGQELLLETELIPIEGEALPEWELNKPLESNNNNNNL